MTHRRNLIRPEPAGAPTQLEHVKWNLPLGVKSPFTSLKKDEADAAWDSISMGTRGKALQAPSNILQYLAC